MKNHFALILAIVYSALLSAQSSPESIKIFLDCQRGCDFQYFTQEMKYVDFMRDRQEAEVFMQLIRQRSANGGSQFSLQVQGQEDFVGMADTLVFFVNPEDSDNIQRKAILTNIEKAILPYIIKTDWSDKLVFSVEVPSQAEIDQKIEEDPWNNWVFRINADGSLNGEARFSNSRLNTRFTASQVTEKNKFFLSARLSYNKSTFELSDGIETNKNNSKNLFLLYAKSITDHWSVGGFTSLNSSDFANYNFSYSVKPAIEYSIFPYSANTVKEFKILYRIGLVHNRYNEITVFDQTIEDILQQNLGIEYKLIKDWGTIEVDFEINNYPRRIAESSISFRPELEWNIFKGFSLNLFGEGR